MSSSHHHSKSKSNTAATAAQNAAAVERRKLEERALKSLRELAALTHNKHCNECNERGPTYVDTTVGTFVCTTCSGVLRGLNPMHRIKSINMSAFTQEEVDFIRDHGNHYAHRVYMSLYDSTSSSGLFADTKDLDKLRDFLSQKYERKRWFMQPSEALAQQIRQETLSALAASSSSSSAAANHHPPLVFKQNKPPPAAPVSNGASSAATTPTPTQPVSPKSLSKVELHHHPHTNGVKLPQQLTGPAKIGNNGGLSSSLNSSTSSSASNNSSSVSSAASSGATKTTTTTTASVPAPSIDLFAAFDAFSLNNHTCKPSNNTEVNFANFDQVFQALPPPAAAAHHPETAKQLAMQPTKTNGQAHHQPQLPLPTLQHQAVSADRYSAFSELADVATTNSTAAAPPTQVTTKPTEVKSAPPSANIAAAFPSSNPFLIASNLITQPTTAAPPAAQPTAASLFPGVAFPAAPAAGAAAAAGGVNPLQLQQAVMLMRMMQQQQQQQHQPVVSAVPGAFVGNPFAPAAAQQMVPQPAKPPTAAQTAAKTNPFL